MSKENLHLHGYTLLPGIFSKAQTVQLIELVDSFQDSEHHLGKPSELFAIRRFLHQVPLAQPHFLQGTFRKLVDVLASPSHQLVKSIYFDKPERSNWFVARHQDLTISVKERKTVEGFQYWTHKQFQHAVQPPLSILENIVTFRVHLDDTDEGNGALRVLPGTHSNGIVRPSQILEKEADEKVCCVTMGGVMVMSPLLVHRSLRSLESRRRRVIHLEFSSMELPGGLEWSERI